MISNNATAYDLIHLIDQLKDFKRNITATDVSPLIDRFLDYLFKTPLIPLDSLDTCAQELYNGLYSLDGGISDARGDAYKKYDDMCSEIDNFDTEDNKTKLLNAVKDIHNLNDDIELVSNMMESLEKLFISIATRHEAPI